MDNNRRAGSRTITASTDLKLKVEEMARALKDTSDGEAAQDLYTQINGSLSSMQMDNFKADRFMELTKKERDTDSVKKQLKDSSFVPMTPEEREELAAIKSKQDMDQIQMITKSLEDALKDEAKKIKKGVLVPTPVDFNVAIEQYFKIRPERYPLAVKLAEFLNDNIYPNYPEASRDNDLSREIKTMVSRMRRDATTLDSPTIKKP